jgi:hypothetical protein
MRVAAIFVVLIIHVVLFVLFAALRIPVPRAGEKEAPSTAFFLPPDAVDTTAEGAPHSPTAAQAAHPTSPKQSIAAGAKSPGAIVRPEPEWPPQPAPAAPDWRQEMQIAANDEIEADERKRRKSSPLAPHDFSGVRPGSTDDTKRAYGWSHAATHRVEAIPSGGLLINVNDRCTVVWVVFPFPLCKVGKIPVRGDLFQDMKDPPAPGEPELP